MILKVLVGIVIMAAIIIALDYLGALLAVHAAKRQQEREDRYDY